MKVPCTSPAPTQRSRMDICALLCGRGAARDLKAKDAEIVVAVGDAKHGAYEKVPSMPAAAGGRRLMLLVNARARDTDLNKAVRRLRIRGAHELLVHELKRDSEAEKVIRAASDAAAQDPDKAFHVFIACGSDSTVNAVAGALVACGAPADTCLAIVPKGPGSHDLAGSLGLPFNAYEALEVAAAAQCAPFDLGTLNKRQVFLSKVVGGLAAASAAASAGAPADDFAPTVSYIILPDCQGTAARPLEHGGSKEACPSQEGAHGTLAYLSVACAAVAEDNSWPSAGAVPDDGLLDVTYAVGLTGDEVALMGQGVAMGTMPSGARAQLQSVQVPWLEVHAPGGLQVLLDGREVTEEDLRFEVLPRRLRLAVPGGQLPARGLQQPAANGGTKHGRNASSGGSSGGALSMNGDAQAALLSSQGKKEE